MITLFVDAVLQYYVPYITDGRFSISLEGSGGKYVCAILISLSVLFGSTSVAMLICVGFDRLHALFWPFHYRQLANRHSKTVGIVTLILNTFLAVPFIFYVKPQRHPYFDDGPWICW